MKNTLRVTIFFLVLAAIGPTNAQTQSGIPGPGPLCSPDGTCIPQ